LALALFAAVVSANVNAHLTAVGRVRGADQHWGKFVRFVHQYKREYTSVREVNAKFDIFRDNMKVAAERQKRNPLARHGVTKFSDITQEEFERTYLVSKDAANDWKDYVANLRKTKGHVHIPKNVSNDVDWCGQGQCTPIKDQGQCGSCWAFSATETFESMLIAAGKFSTSQALAPQQIVSCDTGGSDQGCQGGMPASAIQYLQGAGGQCAEDSYPYTSGQSGQTGDCQLQGTSCPGGGAFAVQAPAGSTPTQQGDEGLQAALQGSVVSVGVDASQWNSYSGGILTDCGTQLDHAVVATGFSSSGGSPYYIVRNSWGTGWGENGFIFIAASGDVCGIADNAITVQV